MAANSKQEDEMIRCHNFTKALLLLFLCVVFVGCNKTPIGETETALTSSDSTPTKVTRTPTATAIPDTATPTLGTNNMVITPEDVFVIPPLSATNISDPLALCENVPSPEIAKENNMLTLLVGRFSLCVLRAGISAIDLDSGLLVNSDSKEADLQIGHSKSTLDSTVFYYVEALNNAHLDEINTDSISYAYCEDTLLSLNRPGIFLIEQGAIACVKTTKGQIALIRAESVDLFGLESVEFSFAILKK